MDKPSHQDFYIGSLDLSPYFQAWRTVNSAYLWTESEFRVRLSFSADEEAGETLRELACMHLLEIVPVFLFGDGFLGKIHKDSGLSEIVWWRAFSHRHIGYNTVIRIVPKRRLFELKGAFLP